MNEIRYAAPSLRPLMRYFGATGDQEAFYWAVNRALHAVEAEDYDMRHASMFQEERRVWRRLAGYLPAAPDKLNLLDVGCGTGLVGAFLAEICPERIGQMTCLDPSPAMLDRTRERSADWPFQAVFRTGDVESLPDGVQFDGVTINSVLHHILYLEPFLRRVETLVRPGGVVLTAQDPRSAVELRRDAVFRSRRLKQPPQWYQPIGLLRHWVRHTASGWRTSRFVRRILNRELPQSVLAVRASETLLKEGVVQRAMDQDSLYAVADVHVPLHPLKRAGGIDPAVLDRYMPGCRLMTRFSYCYRGAEYASLDAEQRADEKRWFEEHDPHGATLAMVFEKTRDVGEAW